MFVIASWLNSKRFLFWRTGLRLTHHQQHESLKHQQVAQDASLMGIVRSVYVSNGVSHVLEGAFKDAEILSIAAFILDMLVDFSSPASKMWSRELFRHPSSTTNSPASHLLRLLLFICDVLLFICDVCIKTFLPHSTLGTCWDETVASRLRRLHSSPSSD